MSQKNPKGDLVLLVPTSGPILIEPRVLSAACQILKERLACEAVLTQPSDAEPFEDPAMEATNSPTYERTVLIPCGFDPLNLSAIRSAWWFGHLPESSEIFVADPWTPKDIGRWIGNRAAFTDDASQGPTRLSLDHSLRHNHLRSEQEVQTIVLIAFWANRIHSQAVILQESDRPISNVPTDVLTDEQIDAEELATWMIQRYLRAVQSRAIPWSDSSDSEWPALKSLHNQLREQLPSEYSERLDRVSPKSMGSAKISADDSGKVPWDKIWTSFCDLAMAGGPPHRGRLLEPVGLDTIEKSPEPYRSVVDELRRGITLASGLATCDSPYLGWVCVECDSQQMAAWLMRAILVENIAVRREEDKLYLPAGPEFRIDKEIKNVITAVAKTNHYWRAHLRSRQPPKPL